MDTPKTSKHKPNTRSRSKKQDDDDDDEEEDEDYDIAVIEEIEEIEEKRMPISDYFGDYKQDISVIKREKKQRLQHLDEEEYSKYEVNFLI